MRRTMMIAPGIKAVLVMPWLSKVMFNLKMPGGYREAFVIHRKSYYNVQATSNIIQLFREAWLQWLERAWLLLLVNG